MKIKHQPGVKLASGHAATQGPCQVRKTYEKLLWRVPLSSEGIHMCKLPHKMCGVWFTCQRPFTWHPACIALQTQQHFDLLLAVQPTEQYDYGGRHITIAVVKATSRDAAAAAVKQCSHILKDSQTKAVGWRMKKGPACFGHMDAGATTCKDDHRWGLTDE